MDGRDDEAPLPLGSLIEGAFRLIRVISQGGHGTVYEAVQTKLGRRVAVKVMSSELLDNEEAQARFRRELHITSQLAHPHIVQLLDFGATPNGHPYLVTEFLEGEDLDQRLAKVTRMSLDQTLAISRQVVLALATVHARGIVHRDLKPGNVLLLTVDGLGDFVKLLDFGISKVATATTQLTRPSAVLGTPGYMSPEQADGRSELVNHSSDQWALGAMVWHMLSGQPPFTGRTLDELLGRVVNDDPPPLADLMPGLPVAARLDGVLRRALAKAQRRRFPTVVAFQRALDAAATPPP
jgi:eukaryotic-like serine/threonine-protein kinase